MAEAARAWLACLDPGQPSSPAATTDAGDERAGAPSVHGGQRWLGAWGGLGRRGALGAR
jgi:hypothetical protein